MKRKTNHILKCEKYLNGPGILLLGIYIRGVCLYDVLYMNVYNGSIYNCQIVKITQMSINRGMEKKTVVYPCHGTLVSNKKDELLIHATTYMNLKILSLSENSQTQENISLYVSIYIKS